MTGAPIPKGCDTVVPIEDVEIEGEWIRVRSAIGKGANVRPRGEDIRAGNVVIKANTVIRPAEVGMLAAMGMTSLGVVRRARVAILATGDELIEPGTTPRPGMTINSNSFAMTALVLDAGAEPLRLGIARDTLECTKERIGAGLTEDMIIITGGVSVGDRDFVKPAIEALGGELLFWKVNMKPGKPVAFGTIGNTPVFALPGNPVAAMVAFELFVRPAILKAMGRTRIFRAMVNARLEGPLENKGNRVHMVRGRVSLQNGMPVVRTTGNQSSARLSSIVDGNGLIRTEPERSYRPGDLIEVMLVDRDFGMLPAAG
jgi:molybdopterin molybdotransferase